MDSRPGLPTPASSGTQLDAAEVHHWVEHTAELELAIDAATECDVFSDAMSAVTELLSPDADAQPTTSRRVCARAADRATLLAAWLEELVFLAESQGFVPVALQRLDLQSDRLEATVVGRIGEPPPVVKAVTYHRLSFTSSNDRLKATVVLDV